MVELVDTLVLESNDLFREGSNPSIRNKLKRKHSTGLEPVTDSLEDCCSIQLS